MFVTQQNLTSIIGLKTILSKELTVTEQTELTMDPVKKLLLNLPFVLF